MEVPVNEALWVLAAVVVIQSIALAYGAGRSAAQARFLTRALLASMKPEAAAAIASKPRTDPMMFTTTTTKDTPVWSEEFARDAGGEQ